MSTIKDVARYAGVSVTTVSRVMNGYPHVDPRVRERVQRAAEAIGYRANSLARSMRQGYTRSLGLVVRDMASANFALICAAAEAAAEARGFQLFVCNTNRDTARERRYIAALLERRVDGLILFAADERVSNLDLLGEAGPPAVLVETDFLPGGFDRISSDGERAAMEATRYLIGLGHRQIAFLAWGQAVTVGRSRLNGYLKALGEAEIEPDLALVRHCGVDARRAGEETRFALLQQPRPTALIIGATDLTTGALLAVREMGLAVPDQFSIIAFDDSEATQFFCPPVTVMDRAVGELGSRAVEMLLDRLEGAPEDPERRAVVPFRLVERQSTGPPQT